ncbi:Conserved TM helix repeat-containing protein [Rippkaea orientalis PCC 8801]|uniref:Conserved TM helix repeat-containing protein n=1 Tax=Rippkaea orientalis (strain PCC 8801 / RF-1) TaxID=41431 RepID=B7K3M4_RIPO1|nr:mechanosensitive ion channel [Rippkaea orientalis]ACK65366.1 Conserved TM helix repeat-containing protein [Rippkaea orientalis PCC 8801]
MSQLSPWVIAQLESFPSRTSSTGLPSQSPINQILTILGQDVFVLIKAIFILVVGWIVASIVRRVIHQVLNQTQIDNQIAQWISGQTEDEDSFPIEKWIADFVYWLIILFTIVAVLNTLNLQAASQPLNALLQQITAFVPKLLGAGVLLGVAWLLATLTKMIVVRLLGGLRVDERLRQQVGETESENQVSLQETIGNALYWFIFLLFLPSILSTLNLQGTLVPIQQLLNDILGILPNILAAVLIGAVGWTIAQIVQRVVTNLLAATGVDQIGTKLGLSTARGSQSLSQILGTIVYALILIPVAITALDALKIQAISQPATEMLNQVLNLLPKLFAATAVLGIAYGAGQYLSEMVSNILTSVGFNNILQWLGLSQVSSPPKEETTEFAATENSSDAIATRTPSQLVGMIVLVAVMLVAALTAVDILKIEALKTVVGTLLAIAAQVLVGLVVLALGLYLANLAFNLITSSGTRQAKFLGHTARISILILVSAMALQQMGLATNIVNLAFGLLVGGIAAAIALAFGLGGRDVAAEQLREWLNHLKQD